MNLAKTAMNLGIAPAAYREAVQLATETEARARTTAFVCIQDLGLWVEEVEGSILVQDLLSDEVLEGTLLDLIIIRLRRG